MDKFFGTLRDISILIVILSLTYIVVNINSIVSYASLYLGNAEKIKIEENINKENKAPENDALFLYNNSKEVKRNKENNFFEGEDIINKLNITLDELILIKKDNNKAIEKELEKKRKLLIEKKKKENNTFSNDITINEDNFFSLSYEMTSKERAKYKNQSYIVIPKLNIEAPIFYPNIEEKDLENHIMKILEKGVVHRPETQLPFQKGNFFILGHSSNYAWVNSKYNNIFSKIDFLNLGDEVKVFYEGRKYIYTLSEKKIVNNDAIEVYGYIPGYNLSIMTCWPIGSTKKRMIAIFSLKKNNENQEF